MQQLRKDIISRILKAALILSLWPAYSHANVCTTGTGIPPFLDGGADPNLLLAIDNSGSMLDVAYVNDGDPDAVLSQAQIDAGLTKDDVNGSATCFDDTYLKETIYNSSSEGSTTIPPFAETDASRLRKYVGYFGSQDIPEPYFQEQENQDVRNPLADPWYVWVEGTDLDKSPWPVYQKSTSYPEGTIVLDNGIFYRADCGGAANSPCTSGNADSIDKDTLGDVTWVRADAEDYVSGQEYGSAGSINFVRYQGILYRSSGIVPADTASPPVATSVWTPVEHTWQSGATVSYSAGDVVSYKGMLYIATSSFTGTSAAGLLDDQSSGSFPWKRMDGHWQLWAPDTSIEEDDRDYSPSPCQLAASAAPPSFSHTYPFSGIDPYTGATVTSVTDLQITILSNNLTDNTTGAPLPPTPIYAIEEDWNNNGVLDPDEDLSPPGTPGVGDFDTRDSVSCFAARANFLNWATSSKFDIQKMILTGGKYYEGERVEDGDGNVVYTPEVGSTDQRTDYDDLLISENRGCAGSSFIKQVTLDSNGTADLLDDIKLTLRIRGSDDDDFIDAFDDTTRIDILDVSQRGFDAGGQCQEAIDWILDFIEPGGSQGGGQLIQAVDDCLTNNVDRTDQRPALNHALQYCWFGWRDNPQLRDLTTIIGDCESAYETFPIPSNITQSDDAYNCSGIFDDGESHDQRDGFVGRCWETGVVAGGPYCQLTEGSPSLHLSCSGNECEWWPNNNSGADNVGDGDLLRYTTDSNYVEYCTQFNNDNDDCQNNNKWALWYTDSVSGDICNPSDPAYFDSSSSGWSADGVFLPEGDSSNIIPQKAVSAGEEEEWWCVYQAMEDYCDFADIAQVIDPSDKATTSGDVSNLPALLIDTGVLVQLGIDRPLHVSKGYVKYDLPAAQKTDEPEMPDGPRRVLYNAASQYAIRLGAMAFNHVGSAAECSQVQVSDQIVPYCPGDNRDGARIMSQIKRGKFIDVDGEEDWEHYKELINKINGLRATSWTPLAEAFYTALGYYAQNSAWKLNDDDFYTAVDAAADPTDERYPWLDPVQYWCQENHVLIITEGASTADINGNVATLATANNDPDTGDRICTGELYGSTYLDDLTYFGRDGQPLYLGEDESVLGRDPNDPLRDEDDVPIEAATGHSGIGLSPLFSKLLPTGTVDSLSNLEIYTKQPIETHFVTTGTLRGTEVTATDECSPTNIMANSASNGGTQLFLSENPDEVEENLSAVFRNIAQRVSSGSAASVISSSRSGSGAVYQAVFWPEILRENEDDGNSVLNWVGDVHAFFVDNRGHIWDDYSDGGEGTTSLPIGSGTRWSEDENGNGFRDTGEEGSGCLKGDRRVFFDFNEETKTTYICHQVEVDTTTDCYANAILSAADNLKPEDCPETCSQATDRDTYCDTPYYVDPSLVDPDDSTVELPDELADFDDYLWSANKQLASVIDINTNRSISNDGQWNWSGTTKRYIFTWSDLNGNGIVDTDLDYDGIVDVPPGTPAGDDDDEIIMLEPRAGLDWDDEYGERMLQDFMIASHAEIASAKTTDAGNGDDAMMDAINTEMNDFISWLRGSDGPWEDADATGAASVFDVTDDINGNGIQDYVYRCRREESCYQTVTVDDKTLRDDPPLTADNPTWRLSDIIHSTPKLVAQPAEAFQTIYRDLSYAEFVKAYRYRRNVIYFGTNMLHAINGGFYDSANDKYWENFEYQTDGTQANLCFYDNGDVAGQYADGDFKCPPNDPSYGPKLGMEMSAYVPFNLQPHLKCMSDPDYGDKHKYFVDKEPRIFDMQIFPDDEVHPEGWGTILVGAMRFGGHPITAATHPDGTWDPDNDDRQFISSYFVLDITDPERPPRLLGEMTRTTELVDPNDINSGQLYADLGYSTPMVTGVVGRNESGTAPNTTVNSKWYLLFGNGPTTLKGENGLPGTVAILPMSWLSGTMWAGDTLEFKTGTDYARKPFRFLSAAIGDGVGNPGDVWTATNYDEGGVLYLPPWDYIATDGSTEESDISFLSDMITLDLTLETRLSPQYGGIYNSDAVYFGTVDGTGFDPVTNEWGDDSTGGGGGRLVRLITSEKTNSDSMGGTNDSLLAPEDWYFKTLLDAAEPITAAPSAGWDGANFWIYFGTGRFFSNEDKSDASIHNFFGIKEPLNSATDSFCEPTWETVVWDPNALTQTLTPASDPGDRGLFRSDWVLVPEAELSGLADPLVFCDPSSPADSCDLADLNIARFCDDPLTEGTTETICSNYKFKDLQEYIAGEMRDVDGNCSQGGSGQDIGVDGWYLQFHGSKERVLGTSTLIGGLNTFTTYQPNTCLPEGSSYLYGVHYQTGTAYYENVFGIDLGRLGFGGVNPDYPTVKEKYSLGTGMSTTPSLHTGSSSNFDAKAFVQTSTGEIIEIGQDNLPIKPPKSGRLFWRDDQNQ